MPAHQFGSQIGRVVNKEIEKRVTGHASFLITRFVLFQLFSNNSKYLSLEILATLRLSFMINRGRFSCLGITSGLDTPGLTKIK
jgi:hypothetical protein